MNTSNRIGLVLATAILAAPSAHAQGAPPSPGPGASVDQGPPLDARLTALLGRAGGLTSDQVAARARATSYDVQSKKAEVDAAESQRSQVVATYVPRVKGTASYVRTSPLTLAPFPGFSITYPENNGTFQLDVDVPISDLALKIAKQYASLEHSARAAQLTERASELAASSNARLMYYAWARAKLNLVVAQSALEQARLHAQDAKAELDAGKISRADVMAVQAQVAQSELLVTRAQNEVSLEESRLHTAMHDDPRTHYEIGEALLADPPPMPGEDAFPPLAQEALSKRAELQALGETARGLRAQAAASKVDMLPKIDGVGTAQYANPQARYFPPDGKWHAFWSLGAALTWTTTDLILGNTNGNANEARASSAEAQALAMRDAIGDEVMAAWQDLHVAEIAIETTQRSLAAAEEAYRVRRALFRAERATSTELTDQERVLTQARFEAVNAHIDLRMARVRLAHATGRDDVGQP